MKVKYIWPWWKIYWMNCGVMMTGFNGLKHFGIFLFTISTFMAISILTWCLLRPWMRPIDPMNFVSQFCTYSVIRIYLWFLEHIIQPICGIEWNKNKKLIASFMKLNILDEGNLSWCFDSSYHKTIQKGCLS